VIVCYVVEVSDEVVASIFRVGVAKVCRLYRHEFRQTHFTVCGAGVTPLCCFSVFTLVLRPVSGLWSPITGLRDRTGLDTPHSVGLLLGEWSARLRDLWQHTALNKRQTSKPPAGFEPTIPTSGRPQTYPLGCAATEIGHFSVLCKLIEDLKRTSLSHPLFVSHIALPTAVAPRLHLQPEHIFSPCTSTLKMETESFFKISVTHPSDYAKS
jgi:hypothetical protein